jgi:acetyltransferase-like isoleucine patch superfamily enzyme
MSGIFIRLISRIFHYIGNKEQLLSILEKEIQAIKLKRLKSGLQRCGDNLWVQFPITISQSEKVEIGSNVSFAAYVHIWGGGNVKIGDRVMIGTHTSISSLTHDYTQPRMFGTLIERPVVIEDDVWIGSNAVILPGVTVGRGAVVGAGAVVAKNVPERAIVGGIPAKVLKMRAQ